MKLTTVTIETDGLRDFMRLPSGERYILGTVSIVKLLAASVPDTRLFRRAVSDFNRLGQAAVVLDVDRAFELLAPRRARWASVTIPLIPSPEWTTFRTEGTKMSDVKAFDSRLSYVERHVTELEKRTASDMEIPESLLASFKNAAVHLPDFGDQSKNDAFYGLGAPKVDTVEEGWEPPKEVTHPKMASVRTLRANAELAETILTQVAETTEKVDALAAAGRPFNAAKARADLHKIACDCAGILKDADLAQPYVANDLGELAKQANHIHGLFASARV